MAPVIGVVQFPGSNCELDVVEAIEGLGGNGRVLWHGNREVSGVDGIVLPGGFAHGDYLRPGAIARFSAVMESVIAFAADGGPVLGICNGFQVLTEAGLLPGALQKNHGLKFRCSQAHIRVETIDSAATGTAGVGDVLEIPINHFEGNYTCSPETLDELRANDQIVFRYVDNPNGSTDDIAGVCNAQRNVVGLMPHPERACHPLLGSVDGRSVLGSMLAWTSRGTSALAAPTSASTVR